MNKTWLKYLVGISAVLVAGCAAYFSVTGLGVLFAGAAISVMVMAGSLELAKLVAATYLKQEWDTIKGFNKWYLTISVGTLMLITSAGIFGYLSNAFQQQNLGLQKVERDIAVYQTQITKNEVVRVNSSANTITPPASADEESFYNRVHSAKTPRDIPANWAVRWWQMILAAEKDGLSPYPPGKDAAIHQMRAIFKLNEDGTANVKDYI